MCSPPMNRHGYNSYSHITKSCSRVPWHSFPKSQPFQVTQTSRQQIGQSLPLHSQTPQALLQKKTTAPMQNHPINQTTLPTRAGHSMRFWGGVKTSKTLQRPPGHPNYLRDKLHKTPRPRRPVQHHAGTGKPPSAEPAPSLKAGKVKGP